MLAKVFARAVEASFHRGHTRIENLGNFSVTPTFLDQREQRTILRSQLRERVPERIELLRIDCAGRLGDVLVLLAKRQEDSTQLLAPQLIDARVAGQPE